VRQAEFGNVPALVVDWRGNQPTGRLYRGGLNDAENCEAVFFEEAPISTAQLKEVLDGFYEKSLRTPALVVEGHANRVWRDPSKGIPEHRPEEVVQGRLLDVLKATFSRHGLRAEPVTEDGRADIIVSSRALSQGSRPATITEWVLELKALCDMTSTGTKISSGRIPQAIRDGLEQVVGYKLRLNGEKAAVCCYDMQKSDAGDETCFAQVKHEAAICNVELWRWYLYRDTKESRKARGYLTYGLG